MQKTAIILLAAGSSSRMGTIKQALPYKKTTLLGWSLKTAIQSNANSVFCVLGANKKTLEKIVQKNEVPIITNPNYKKGLSSSIIAGILQVEENYDNVLIMLADQPNITSEYLNELIKTSSENPEKIIASNYNEKAGVPVVFPKAYFNDLKTLKGDNGAKMFLKENLSAIIKMPPTNLVDIDTLKDYKNLIDS
ncbi:MULTISPECIES: NTP transferase domain-containing protein [unclassified Tenacibaculum]|uniref:nucleotidyltransferase family protein n=1 Tax=unclassified Tenacibaculum TaxID=2635139 RepID=UPI001F3E836C|nr:MULTISPECIES: nucleotidyltransferase family protein [unclassified Tenacibaculum]MCF2873722.1 nucleotidyltransferase family protein [Tenacibaculum sp. Cn5-1]MCF2933878.1 nucleotidyltransferase family protein [Tenacibaculum sp. Cn5-34]MCG7509540.1 nucleotidyltransferase family protein [Tenacibaculum sp. Cn5-46]